MKTTIEDRARRKAQIDNLDVIQAWQPVFMPSESLSRSDVEDREEAIYEIITRLKSDKALYSEILARSNHEKLIISIIDAVMCLESLILRELNFSESEHLNKLLDPVASRKKISELKKDLAAFERMAKKGVNVKDEQKTCEIELTIAQNHITLSREQEARLNETINKYPSVLTLIEPLSLKRKNIAPSKKCRDQLIKEVHALLNNHACNDLQRKRSKNIPTISKIISVISPRLNSSAAFKPKDIENALY